LLLREPILGLQCSLHESAAARFDPTLARSRRNPAQPGACF